MAAKTFEFEDELPDLPLPELNDTLNLYLDTLRPFLSLSEFKEVEVIVRDFENGIGQKLHEKLRERACNNKNWVRILYHTDIVLLTFQFSRLTLKLNTKNYNFYCANAINNALN